MSAPGTYSSIQQLQAQLRQANARIAQLATQVTNQKTSATASTASTVYAYKRDFAPAGGYATLAAFLAGTYYSAGQALTAQGEIFEAWTAQGGQSDAALYSMVVSAPSACTVPVSCLYANDSVLLYADGTLLNTWSLGEPPATPKYSMSLGQGQHVIQFLLHNASADAEIFIGDWLNPTLLTWVRAARS